jgi:hypothetical protein
MNGPTQLLQHLALAGYHPRSDAHSNAICDGLLNDLLDNCEAIRAKAVNGGIVAQINSATVHRVCTAYRERWAG